MFENIKRAPVDDAGVGTEGVETTPLREHGRKRGRLLAVVTNVAFQEHEVVSQLLGQFVSKGALGCYVKGCHFPAFPDEPPRQFGADSGLCKFFWSVSASMDSIQREGHGLRNHRLSGI